MRRYLCIRPRIVRMDEAGGVRRTGEGESVRRGSEKDSREDPFDSGYIGY